MRTRTIMVRPLEEKPVWPEGLKPLPADQLEPYTLRCVGARPWDRDAIDQRILETLRERKGAIIDSQEAAGGYPGL